MIQDIIKDMNKVDLLVSSNVCIHDGEPSIFDLCLHLVRREDDGSVKEYFYLTLDTGELCYSGEVFYDAATDTDKCSEVEYYDDGTLAGYTQFRRATEAERIMFYIEYNDKHKDYFDSNLSHHHLPDDLDLSSSHALMADDNPFVPLIPDYVKQ